MFFKERWYGFDDGFYTGARLLEIVSRHADANPVLKGLPNATSTPELNIKMNEGEPLRWWISLRPRPSLKAPRVSSPSTACASNTPTASACLSVQHHPGGGAALRGRQPGRHRAHPGRLPPRHRRRVVG